MTPRLHQKRHSAVVCSIAVLCGLLMTVFLAHAQENAGGGAEQTSVGQAIQAIRTNRVQSAVSPRQLKRSEMPASVTDSPAAQQMKRRAAMMHQPQQPLTVISNGVVVIPESVVTGPEVPLSKDPVVAARQINERWTRKQHDLVYADPELKRMHDEIKSLEKELLAKRQALAARLASNPEMAKVNEERMKAFETLARAREAVNRASPPQAQP